MSQETLDKIKEWINSNYVMPQYYEGTWISVNELEEFLETLITTKEQ